VLEFTVANPADTTLAVAQLIFSGVLHDRPGLNLCLCHGGGFLPWQSGRMDATWSMMDPASRTPQRPSEQLRRLWYDTIIHGPDAIDFLTSRVGVDRVVLGTDYPFALGDLTPLESIRASSLGAADFERVTEANGQV